MGGNHLYWYDHKVGKAVDKDPHFVRKMRIEPSFHEG